MKIAAFAVVLLLLGAVAGMAADMEMQSVKSSLIDKIGYDADAKTLAVQMHNSLDVYLYEEVPASVFEQFQKADSKGRFFVEHIKGQYKSKLD